MKWNSDQIDSIIKLIIGTTFCLVILMMSGVATYSIVFVTQPMTGIAPVDKALFALLSDISKYCLGALATLLALRGKDGVTKLIDPPPGVSKASDWIDPQPPAPKAPAPVHQRVEPILETSPPPPVAAGFNGKAAPPAAPQPEL